MPHSSKRKSISKAEFYQLVGLRALADTHTVALKNIVEAANAITQESGLNGQEVDFGHTADCMYGSRDVKEALRLMGLLVDKK